MIFNEIEIVKSFIAILMTADMIFFLQIFFLPYNSLLLIPDFQLEREGIFTSLNAKHNAVAEDEKENAILEPGCWKLVKEFFKRDSMGHHQFNLL